MKQRWHASKEGKVEKLKETHLWSDGFSRDSGLKGAGRKSCRGSANRDKETRRREGGRKEGRTL